MNKSVDQKLIRDERNLTKERCNMSETHEDWFVNGFPDEGALLDLSSDDPLDPPSCNKDDPECEACQ